MTAEGESAGEFEEWIERQQRALGARLRAERERLGMSASSFAAAMGLHRNTIRYYEAGERAPDAGFWSVAKGLGIDVDAVLAQPTPPSAAVCARDLGRLFFDLLEVKLPVHGDALRLAFWAFLADADEALRGSPEPLRLPEQVKLVNAAIENGPRFAWAISGALESNKATTHAELVRSALSLYGSDTQTG